MVLPIDQQKQHMRAYAKQVRAKAHAAGGETASKAIAVVGLEFSDLQVGTDHSPIVSGYAALPGELDPAILLAGLHGAGFSLALPVTIGRAIPLIFRNWMPGDAMGKGYQGIAEPVPSAAEVLPDIVLLPLLAFDDQGYRLGYGGGHYDRTLVQLRAQKPVIAVGLAYDQQKVDAVPHDRYDQRLDWILTPSGARAFTES